MLWKPWETNVVASTRPLRKSRETEPSSVIALFKRRSKVLHLNKLATHIVQEMARVHIPDPPPVPPRPEPLPPPTVEIDLNSVHERLTGLDRVVNDLTKLIREKEETVLYVIKNRPSKGEIATTAHSTIRSGGLLMIWTKSRSNTDTLSCQVRQRWIEPSSSNTTSNIGTKYARRRRSTLCQRGSPTTDSSSSIKTGAPHRSACLWRRRRNELCQWSTQRSRSYIRWSRWWGDIR